MKQATISGLGENNTRTGIPMSHLTPFSVSFCYYVSLYGLHVVFIGTGHDPEEESKRNLKECNPQLIPVVFLLCKSFLNYLFFLNLKQKSTSLYVFIRFRKKNQLFHSKLNAAFAVQFDVANLGGLIFFINF